MPHATPDNQRLREKRAEYAYPAVALDGTLAGFQEVNFESTIAQDRHLHKLLHSQSDDASVLGYLAVLFWGHYSGQDRKIRRERAFGKVRLAYEGADRLAKGKTQRIRGISDIGTEKAAGYIVAAIKSISDHDYSQALVALQNLPGLGIAFASKICAFIEPSRCGVIDSVIAEKHPELGFSLRDGYVTNTKTNRDIYNEYCKWLQGVARNINADAANSTWADRDGMVHPWRAVDVERALY